jgi:type II secretory pathway pseudopilin PulG
MVKRMVAVVLFIAVPAKVADLVADVNNDAVRLIDGGAAILFPGPDRNRGLSIGVHDKAPTCWIGERGEREHGVTDHDLWGIATDAAINGGNSGGHRLSSSASQQACDATGTGNGSGAL